jgi:hypothetical protein
VPAIGKTTQSFPAVDISPATPANGSEESMSVTRTEAVWNAQANNPYYRITELVLPALRSAGLQRFEFKTTFLPHKAGQLLIKSQGQERYIEIIAGRLGEFESGTESEIVNTTDRELRFTVMEFK